MPDAPSAAAPTRLQLVLQRSASRPEWWAEVQAEGTPRRFETLTELLSWLATLDLPPAPPSPPAGGIR
jgi:hypothetical protein